MKAIFLILLVSLSISVYSQDSTINKHQPIYFKAFAGWKQDGQRLNGKALKTELYKVPEAIPYYKKGMSYYKASFLTSITTLPLVLLGNRRSKEFPYNYKTGFTIAGAITAGATIYLLTRYKKNMKKAVKLYNQY